jgi:P-type E1-E2 ATPase
VSCVRVHVVCWSCVLSLVFVSCLCVRDLQYGAVSYVIIMISFASVCLQIQYIFSDKTGTLTCNEMRFNKVNSVFLLVALSTKTRTSRSFTIHIVPRPTFVSPLSHLTAERGGRVVRRAAGRRRDSRRRRQGPSSVPC